MVVCMSCAYREIRGCDQEGLQSPRPSVEGALASANDELMNAAGMR